MKYKLEIDMDNAMFLDDDLYDGQRDGAHLARLLRIAADDADGLIEVGFRAALCDRRGNVVGSYRVVRSRHNAKAVQA